MQNTDNPWLEQHAPRRSDKYRHCSPAQDDLLYANCDFPFGEEPAADALPSPWQRTPEQTAYARALHEAAARRKMQEQLGAIVNAQKAVRPQPPAWRRLLNRLVAG